jgi:hypothetical protein
VHYHYRIHGVKEAHKFAVAKNDISEGGPEVLSGGLR